MSRPFPRVITFVKRIDLLMFLKDDDDGSFAGYDYFVALSLAKSFEDSSSRGYSLFREYHGGSPLNQFKMIKRIKTQLGVLEKNPESNIILTDKNLTIEKDRYRIAIALATGQKTISCSIKSSLLKYKSPFDRNWLLNTYSDEDRLYIESLRLQTLIFLS